MARATSVLTPNTSVSGATSRASRQTRRQSPSSCTVTSLNGASLEEALQEIDNPEVLCVAGDIPYSAVLDEDEAVAIRQLLHKKRLGRGFYKQNQPRGKGR